MLFANRHLGVFFAIFKQHEPAIVLQRFAEESAKRGEGRSGAGDRRPFGPQIEEATARYWATMQRHKLYIGEHGDDMPEVRDWRWTL